MKNMHKKQDKSVKIFFSFSFFNNNDLTFPDPTGSKADAQVLEDLRQDAQVLEDRVPLCRPPAVGGHIGSTMLNVG
ncbi:hypothetical protein GDO81_025631 [Engystomops pustulosus]|uniref:Uncharacterized protein n=1 Tax=Engystomops pustulosus TaxID=76066 RepID=A0AAV6YS27_ENGPU|nr:hypothetical protein GDO81_025631 [Engystomops pustulosus]